MGWMLGTLTRSMTQASPGAGDFAWASMLSPGVGLLSLRQLEQGGRLGAVRQGWLWERALFGRGALCPFRRQLPKLVLC